MVKKRMFIIFCMIGSLVSEGICRNTARRTGRHTDQTANKRQVVVQLDMPDHEDVPEICLYLNGNQKISDNTGMNRFPAPDKIPSKWYYLITRHFNPTASQVNNVTTFSIAADKAHRLFSCKWNDELKEWIIKEKTEASLAKRSYNLKHPKETIIVNMHPRYLDSIQSPRITSETSNNNVFATGTITLVGVTGATHSSGTLTLVGVTETLPDTAI
ncbi:hypothetical protein COB28_01280, partial [Candidatus Dependentiae bacterium]